MRNIKIRKDEALTAYKVAKNTWWATVTPQGLKDRSIYNSKEWFDLKEAETVCRRLGVRI